MKEVFLYGCEGCNNVIFELHDRGERYYVDQCPACKDWSDYIKITIQTELNVKRGFHETCPVFAVEDKNDNEKVDKH